MDLAEQEKDNNTKNDLLEVKCCQRSTFSFNRNEIEEDRKDVGDLTAIDSSNVAVYNAATLEQSLLLQAWQFFNLLIISDDSWLHENQHTNNNVYNSLVWLYNLLN